MAGRLVAALKAGLLDSVTLSGRGWYKIKVYGYRASSYELVVERHSDKAKLRLKIENKDPDRVRVKIYLDGRYVKDVTVSGRASRTTPAMEIPKDDRWHVLKLKWYDPDYSGLTLKMNVKARSGESTLTIRIPEVEPCNRASDTVCIRTAMLANQYLPSYHRAYSSSTTSSKAEWFIDEVNGLPDDINQLLEFLGTTAADYFVGSCIHEGVATVGCAVDIGTTVLEVASHATVFDGGVAGDVTIVGVKAGKLLSLIKLGKISVFKLPSYAVVKMSIFAGKVYRGVEFTVKELKILRGMGLIDEIRRGGKIVRTVKDEVLFDKFMKYKEYAIKYWRLNPLDDAAGKHKLVKVYNAKGVDTVVGGKTIKDFAVLKEGTNAWGWKHILSKHINDFKRVFGVNTKNEILDLIRMAMENPDKVKYGYNARVGKYEYRVYKKFGNNRYVLIATDKHGSITTSWPTKYVEEVDKFMKFK